MATSHLVNESPKPLSNNVPKYNFLFPQEKVSNLTKPHQEIKIPNEDKAIEFGRAKGVEKFWIIWSAQQIPELELANSIFNQQQDPGVVKDVNKANAIKQLIEKYSSDKLIKIEENKQKRKMEINSSENTVALLLAINHN